MLDLLPLPLTWLAFYVLGRLASGRSVAFRRYLCVAASVALLLAATGWQTCGFFVVLGVTFAVTSAALSRMPEGRKAYLLFVLSVIASVVMIVVFLKFRIYFQKFFVYLPSLSYLGFRGIACLVSAYRKKEVTLSAGLIQMFFFPSLIMGPISRVEDFYEARHDYHDVLRRLVAGFSFLIAGYFVGQYVPDHRLVRTGLDPGVLWLGTIANSFDYYFNFAGYTHLIIGLGLLLGFKLPENFNNPYIATSVSEFWRRWHMSLSFWIRDYVYIPLGGNRKGVGRKCLNLMTAMGLCGLWHGLTLHYFLWGVFHGVIMAGETLMAHYNLTPVQNVLPRGHRVVKIAFTFTLVTFSWILFRYTMPDAVLYLKGLFSW